MGESPYWRKQFKTFDALQGKFRPTWSWTAFIFGLLWYMWKGMWGKAFLLFVAMCALMMTGVGMLVYWVYPALFGKWDYYLLKKRGTHFW